MTHADEDAKQTVAVEVAPENGNALAAVPLALFPIGAAFAVEVRADEALVGRQIGLVIGLAVEAVESVVIRQVFDGGELKPVERDMRPIEIDRFHACRIGGQVGHGIASAGSDGDDAVAGLDGKCRHVDFRVFPDLRIDQPLEQPREQSFGKAPRERALFCVTARLRIVPSVACSVIKSSPDPRIPTSILQS